MQRTEKCVASDTDKAFTIFFDCHSFDTGWQGTTTYLAGILNALPSAAARLAPNLNLTIICAANDENAIRRHITVDFDFVPVRSGFQFRNLFDIPRALRRTRADLMVSQYVRPFFSPCPTMSVIHDVLFLDFPSSFSWHYREVRRLLFGWSARRSSVVSTVSRYSAERIAHHLGIEQDGILLIANGVDRAFATASRSRAVDDSVFRLLSVSRLERRKRHEWGIDALEILSAQGIKASYTIVGSGDDAYARELLKVAASARALRGLDVTVKSGLSFSELVQEYADADLFLCPSVAEGFGIPVIEAGAAGTPCVSTTGGALGELEGLLSGRTVATEDHQGFLDAVSAVASNIETHRTSAQDKRSLVLGSYSWDVAAGAYIDVIQRLVGKRQ